VPLAQKRLAAFPNYLNVNEPGPGAGWSDACTSFQQISIPTLILINSNRSFFVRSKRCFKLQSNYICSLRAFFRLKIYVGRVLA